AGRFREAAACCRTLESIYHDAGHAEEAARYGNLASKYEERGASGAEIPASTPGTALVGAEPPSATAKEFTIAAPGPGIDVHAGESDMAEPAQPAAAASRGSGPSGLFFHAPTSASEPEPSSPETPEFSVAPQEAHSVESDLSNQWE